MESKNREVLPGETAHMNSPLWKEEYVRHISPEFKGKSDKELCNPRWLGHLEESLQTVEFNNPEAQLFRAGFIAAWNSWKERWASITEQISDHMKDHWE